MLAMTAPTPAETQTGPSSAQLTEWLVAVGSTKDRKAFEALFDHFAPRLKAYMLRLGTQPASAEDLAQETMVQVWRKASLYDASKAVPAAWVFRVARNLRIDRLRKQRFHEVDIDKVDIANQDGADSDNQTAERLDAAQLVPLVDALPDDQKEVVRLAFFEGMSHAEIEQHLEIPLGTVKSRMRLAFGKLRKAMGDMS